jgi:hypothetical protein
VAAEVTIGRFYLEPTPAELILFAVAVALAILCYAWIFLLSTCARSFSDDAHPDLLPIELATLAFGVTNVKAEVLYIGHCGALCIGSPSDNFGVPPDPPPDPNPIDACITKELLSNANSGEISAGTVSYCVGRVAPVVDEIVRMSLKRRGLLYQWGILRSIVGIFCIVLPPWFPLVELSFSGQNGAQPAVAGLFAVPIAGFLGYLVHSRLGIRAALHMRWIALVVLFWHVLFVFGLFWSVPCMWDQLTMCAWTALGDVLGVFAIALETGWSPAGAREVGRGLRYRARLIKEEKKELGDAAYIAALTLPGEKLAHGDYVEWALIAEPLQCSWHCCTKCCPCCEACCPCCASCCPACAAAFAVDCCAPDSCLQQCLAGSSSSPTGMRTHNRLARNARHNFHVGRHHGGGGGRRAGGGRRH